MTFYSDTWDGGFRFTPPTLLPLFYIIPLSLEGRGLGDPDKSGLPLTPPPFSFFSFGSMGDTWDGGFRFTPPTLLPLFYIIPLSLDGRGIG